MKRIINVILVTLVLTLSSMVHAKLPAVGSVERTSVWSLDTSEECKTVAASIDTVTTISWTTDYLSLGGRDSFDIIEDDDAIVAIRTNSYKNGITISHIIMVFDSRIYFGMHTKSDNSDFECDIIWSANHSGLNIGS